MKLKALEVLNSITIPGAVGGDTSLNTGKFPGIDLEVSGNVVMVTYKGKVGFIPLSNIRVMIPNEWS